MDGAAVTARVASRPRADVRMLGPTIDSDERQTRMNDRLGCRVSPPGAGSRPPYARGGRDEAAQGGHPRRGGPVITMPYQGRDRPGLK